MLSNIKKIILSIAILIFIVSCASDEKVVPIQTAYDDGFEVVLKKGDNSYLSLHLKEADEFLQKNKGASYLIDKEKIEIIRKSLERISRQYPNSNYPFVGLELKNMGENSQHIKLSYHFSKSTYWYIYLASDKSIKPISSGYHDLTSNTKVIYRD